MSAIRTGLSLALVSASVLCFEIGLTRLFSFFLHYHFTFLVVSGAVCGLGLGAVLAARLKLPADAPHRRLALWAFALAIVLWGATALLVRFPRSQVLLVLAAAVPFILAGIFLSLVFRARAQDSQRLYFYDLTGAALGTLWIIPALQWLGGVDALLSAGCLAALGGGLLAATRLGLATAILFPLLLILHSQFPLASINMEALQEAADKPLFKALGASRHPGQLQQTRWSAYARTDLVDRTGDTGLNIYMDGGAGSYMFRFGGDFRRLSFLRGEAAFFPYYFGARQRALILGPGGGADVLYALMTGWRQIDGVEINPQIVDLVRAHGDYNGQLYDLANVDIHVGDGRNYLQRTQHRYDLIALPLVYAEAADLVGYALQENYLFTGPAMAAYIDHLTPDGRLGLVVHNHLLMLRVITTLAETWRRDGRNPATLLDHLVVLNGTRAPPGASQAYRPLILVQKQPYTAAQLRAMDAVASEVGLNFYFQPGQREPAAITNLRTLGLDAFIAADKRDISPLTDEKPFFYRTRAGLDPRLQRLLWGSGLALALCLLLPIFIRSTRQVLPGAPAPIFFALFAAFLGMAYMLVEIYLLQRLGLFLGYPTLSLAVTLFALLLSSAAGSLLGGRLPALTHARGIGLAALVAAAAAALFGLGQALLLPHTLYLDIGWRVLITALAIMPLGGLMGLCFPASLRLLGTRAAQRVPWLWGLNGIASVLGSVLAVVLSMHWGSNWVLAAGVGAYLLAGSTLLLGSVSNPSSPETLPLPPFSRRRALFFLVAVGLIWYGVFTFIAADYWRAHPAADRPSPPPIHPSVWPQALKSAAQTRPGHF